MIPTLPQHKTYFSLDEVCQWVDISPEALRYWLSAHDTSFGSRGALPTKRSYHRREVLWLCKIKPSIEHMAQEIVGKPVDLSPVRQELQSMLETLSSQTTSNSMRA